MLPHIVRRRLRLPLLLVLLLLVQHPVHALTLKQFIGLLDFTPPGSFLRSSNQYSVTVHSPAFVSWVDVNFYNGNNCISSPTTVTITETAELLPGTYTSTNASNYALCQAYPSTACVGAGTGNTDHIQFIFHLDGDSESGTCSASNYMQNGSNAVCSSGTDCGFFTAIADSLTPINWIGTQQLGTATQQTIGNGVAADSLGNVFITGWTDGGLDGNSLTGTKDVFVTKYDGSGIKRWTRQLGAATTSSGAYAVATDSSNNIFVGGYSDGNFDGHTKTGSRDLILVKYDASGTKLWSKEVGVTTGQGTLIYGLATDISGNILAAGQTTGTLDGDSLIGTYDIFVTKYDPSGSWLWTRQIGGTGVQAGGMAVATDSSSNVIVAGFAYGGVDGNSLTGTSDTVVAKWDSSGTELWSKQFGVSGHDATPSGVTTDAAGGIFIAGQTNGGLDSNPITGTYDLFLTKFNSSGTKLWTRQMGVASVSTTPNGITSDSSGNVFLGGGTNGGLDGNYKTGSGDGFATKYDNNGTKIWTRQFGVISHTASANGIAADPWGSVFAGGNTDGGIEGNTVTGTQDLFLIKIDPPGTFGGACTMDGNCIGGTFCADNEFGGGVCLSGSDNTSASCTRDSNCSNNYFCGSNGDGTGSCTSGGDNISSPCSATNKCNRTYYCSSIGDGNGVCASGNDNTSSACTATSQCTVNYYCSSDGNGGGNCASGNDNMAYSCTLDTDCSYSYFCGSNGDGTGTCSYGNQNTNGVCDADSQCSLNYYCRNDGAGGGVCASGNDHTSNLCISDTECSINYNCFDSFCQASSDVVIARRKPK